MAKKLQHPIVSQLHRLQGQLRGVERLMRKNTNTSQILQQLEAVRGSIKSIETKLLEEKTKKITNPELKQAYKYLLKISS